MYKTLTTIRKQTLYDFWKRIKDNDDVERVDNSVIIVSSHQQLVLNQDYTWKQYKDLTGTLYKNFKVTDLHSIFSECIDDQRNIQYDNQGKNETTIDLDFKDQTYRLHFLQNKYEIYKIVDTVQKE